MKPLGFSIVLSLILFTTGCAAETPDPTPTPQPSPTNTPPPTSTPQLQGPITPEILLTLDNDPDRMKDPYGIALDSSANLYVNDAGNSRVLVFDKAGKLLAKWDKQGSGDGEFKSLGFGGNSRSTRRITFSSWITAIIASKNSTGMGTSFCNGEPKGATMVNSPGRSALLLTGMGTST